MTAARDGKNKKMNTLIQEIYSLEQDHKKRKGQHQELFHQLVNKREDLKDTMEQESKRTFNIIAKERYQWGNKASKHLARMLKKKKEINYIEKIQNKNGDMVYTTTEIAKVFKDYYGALYSVGQKGQRETEKAEKTKEFLKNIRLPLLSVNDKFNLNKPITQEEKPGTGFMIYYYKKYKEILVPRLCQYMNGLGVHFEMGREALSASITVILKYFHAVALTRAVESAKELNEKRWVTIENAMSSTQLRRFI